MDKITKYLKDIRQDQSFIRTDLLDPIPYKSKGNTWVEISNPEFTSLCPETGLPDYGTIHIKFLPDNHIVELKSLKYYFLQFRNTGIYYENLANLILDHLVDVISPKEMIITAEFTARGGISSRVTSTYKK